MNDAVTCGGHPCPVSAALLDAARTLEARLEHALVPLQLSLAKVGVLRVLVHAARPLPLSTIAHHQRCVRSNMTQLADRLEAEGLIRRVADPADRRAVLAEPTDAGRAALASADLVLRDVEARFLTALDQDERVLMTNLVQRFAQITTPATV